MALDRRFAGAHLIHAAADDFQRLLDRAAVGCGAFRFGQLHGDDVARAGHLDIGLPDTGQRDHRLGQRPHQLHRLCHIGGIADLDLQHTGVGGFAADIAHRVAFKAQGIAHFRPKTIDPVLVDIRHLHFGQKMRAAAQIKAQVDQTGGQP